MTHNPKENEILHTEYHITGLSRDLSLPSSIPEKNAITYSKYATMTRCWRMYYYRYVLYLEPTTPSSNVVLGKAFHRALNGEEVEIKDEDPLQEELIKAVAIGTTMRKIIPVGYREVFVKTCLNGIPIEGTLDGVLENTIYEFKYTSSPLRYVNGWNIQWQAGFYHLISGLNTIKFVAVEKPSKSVPVPAVLAEDYKPRFRVETYNYMDNEDWYDVLLQEIKSLWTEKQERERKCLEIEVDANCFEDKVDYYWGIYPRSVGACYSPTECDYIEICKTRKLGGNYKTVSPEDREK